MKLFFSVFLDFKMTKHDGSLESHGSFVTPWCSFPRPQFPACPQFPVPTSLSQFPAPSSLFPGRCPQFPVPPCPQFPVPSSLSPVCCPRHHSLPPDCSDFFQKYDCRDQIQGDEYEDYRKAVWVPSNATGVVPAKASSSVARLRHVSVDPSFHTVDR